jgi:hypothetical protein
MCDLNYLLSVHFLFRVGNRISKHEGLAEVSLQRHVSFQVSEQTDTENFIHIEHHGT